MSVRRNADGSYSYDVSWWNSSGWVWIACPATIRYVHPRWFPGRFFGRHRRLPGWLDPSVDWRDCRGAEVIVLDNGDGKFTTPNHMIETGWSLQAMFVERICVGQLSVPGRRAHNAIDAAAHGGGNWDIPGYVTRGQELTFDVFVYAKRGSWPSENVSLNLRQRFGRPTGQ